MKRIVFWITCVCLRASLSWLSTPVKTFMELRAPRIWWDRNLIWPMRLIGVGSRIRWFLTHGGAIVYNCLRLSSCADEGRADLLAILPSALYSHLTAVFHIYDTIQHFTLAVGADRCRDIIERYIENILELSFTGRTFVVHVPFDQPLFIYTRNIAMVE